jgi:hypothetical protein
MCLGNLKLTGGTIVEADDANTYLQNYFNR